MPLPIISVAQMREWEQATWVKGQTEAAVIARVGKNLADRALKLTRPGEFILVLAGKGHNGDDARAMTPHLPERETLLIPVNDPRSALPAMREALRKCPALVIDGLFGIGLSRELDADWSTLINELNKAELTVLAIDVPSGLDADNGSRMPIAVRAAITVTVGAPKRGFFLNQAAKFVGRLEVTDDVGLCECPLASEVQWTVAHDFVGYPPRRFVGGHKGSFGHAAIVAGSVGYHGASILAARGAQRARPGLVSLFTQPETYNAVAAQTQAVMVHPWREDVNWKTFTAVLFGPGLAAPNLPKSLPDALQKLWVEYDQPLVVDASALAWLPSSTSRISSCRVITPHPGEAARLLNTTVETVQQDRPAALRALSQRYGECWVVLKGQHTLVGRSQDKVFVNSSGNAGLAQGGTGDLLAGYITGWLAQPQLRNHEEQAIRYGVWEHGCAADRLEARRKNWIVEELATELGAA